MPAVSPIIAGTWAIVGFEFYPRDKIPEVYARLTLKLYPFFSSRDMAMRGRLERFNRSDRGSAAVEFALVGPLFILLIIGTVVYGGWMWMAQGVQHLAAEGARAAIAGIDTDERTSLAHSAVSGSLDSTTILNPDAIQVTVNNDPDAIRVTITYDASDHPLMALANLVPSPPRTIRREAVVRTGGY